MIFSTADRQCCPQLIRDTAVANVEGDTVNLSVDTGPGNCTVGEGFRFVKLCINYNYYHSNLL